VSDIKAASGKAVAVGANLANEAEIDKLFKETKKQYGKVDILINNAGDLHLCSTDDGGKLG
jgi:3-oxoacyl-[acyl-carrier protein] reductase